jgi:hypothetical protein
MGEQSDFFARNKPAITEMDVSRAARCHRVVVSWDSLPTSNGDLVTGLALKVMMADGAQETLLVERYPAIVLKNLLEEFEQAEWTMSKLEPREAPAAPEMARGEL